MFLLDSLGISKVRTWIPVSLWLSKNHIINMGLVHEGVTLTNAIAESIQASKLHQVREYPVISPL